MTRVGRAGQLSLLLFALAAPLGLAMPAAAQEMELSAPRQVECVGRTTTQMTLRWTAPVSIAVASYKVRYRTAAAVTYVEFSSTGTNHTLSGLTAGAEYAVGVQSVAADSTLSEWVDAVCATPGSDPLIDLGGIAETLPGGKMTAVFVPALMMVVVMLSSTRNALLSFGCAGLVLVVSLFVVDASPLLLVALVPLVGAGFVYGKVLR